MSTLFKRAFAHCSYLQLPIWSGVSLPLLFVRPREEVQARNIQGLPESEFMVFSLHSSSRYLFHRAVLMNNFAGYADGCSGWPAVRVGEILAVHEKVWSSILFHVYCMKKISSRYRYAKELLVDDDLQKHLDKFSSAEDFYIVSLLY